MLFAHRDRTAAALTAALAALIAVPSVLPAQQATGAGYHVVSRTVVGGPGGWDYVSVDTAHDRVFVTRGDRAIAIAPATGKVLGTIPGMNRAHGVTFAYALNHGFVTSGADSTVTMFDLNTFRVLGTTKAAVDDDAVLFDPASNRVFTFNGDAASVTAINAVTGQRIANMPLPGKPEFGVTAGNGKLYVNIESTNEVAEVDAHSLRVLRHWSIAPCKSPSGLAIDVAHQRLFSGCRNRLMAISDAAAGKVITTVPIGAGVDANAFDPATGDAFASNGDGTLTVVHEDAPNSFHVVQTVQTMRGARTMGLDPKTHRIYTVSAQFAPMPAAAPGAPRQRPAMVPNSFTMLTLER